MSYVFNQQIAGSIKCVDDNNASFSMNGIKSTETNANVIMGGLSELFGIVGWSVPHDVVRTVKQDVNED